MALLAIEESRAAWLRLFERDQITPANFAVMTGDLVWLGEALERVFPKARGFVRPAFDEPDALARLQAAEGHA